MITCHHLEPKKVVFLAEKIASERPELHRLFLPQNDKDLILWLLKRMRTKENPNNFTGFTTMNERICSFHAFRRLKDHKLRERKGAIAAFESFAIFKELRNKGKSIKLLKLALESCAKLTGDGLVSCIIHADNLAMQRAACACGGRRFNATKQITKIRENGKQETYWEYLIPTNDYSTSETTSFHE